ncbi:MAG TPA: LD-carboxypeptidase [Methylomirabilota bacterium]|nr:LD-carboxypeptidase [Methylomirabilota bacterium]
MVALRKPPRLRRGDTIGVVSPAAAVDIEALQRGCETLQHYGFRIRVGAHAQDRHRFLAGTDSDRAAELAAMLQDPAIHAVFCSRAGYGSGRLLPVLNFQTVTRAPKIFLGFSDVTFLLNAFVQQAGLVCFHGPLVAGQLANGAPGRSLEHLFHLLTTGGEGISIAFSHALRTGVAEGRLIGGCLSIVVATLGTSYALDTRGAVLFLEDTGERPYRIDRMLTQLKQAGKLDHLAGVIFGEMPGCFEGMDDPSLLFAVIDDIFSDYTYPIGFGLPAGHGMDNLTLPFGVRVRLDAVRRTLTLLEPAVE